MKLRFAHSEINEVTEGPHHFVNDGEAFEVENSVLADELLHRKARIEPDGDMVNVFEPAVGGEQPAINDEEESELEAGYPEGFPSAEVLAGAGLKFEEAKLLNKEQLVAIKGIGPKSADAILEFGSHSGVED